MKLSISNIAWTDNSDDYMYEQLNIRNIEGLEIAPSRVFKESPYDCIEQAKKYREYIEKEYRLHISSMQSIWYGLKENIFTSEENRKILLKYTQKAVRFAETIGCNNLVFGCPQNRNKPENADMEAAYNFLKQLGDYAYHHNTILAIEANPVIYNTNFINTTKEAIELVQRIDSKGLMVNFDLSTCIYNKENLDVLANNMKYINHVHISEPYLERIEKRKIHSDLAKILKNQNYQKYVSIEMKKRDSTVEILQIVDYIMEVF